MLHILYVFFFFNDTATTEIYTLSLHDALPISTSGPTKPSSHTRSSRISSPARASICCRTAAAWCSCSRSEEHTSELQSRGHLVCRLLLEKKNTMTEQATNTNNAKVF